MSVIMFIDGLGDWMEEKGFAMMLTSIVLFAIAVGLRVAGKYMLEVRQF